MLGIGRAPTGPLPGWPPELESLPARTAASAASGNADSSVRRWMTPLTSRPTGVPARAAADPGPASARAAARPLPQCWRTGVLRACDCRHRPRSWVANVAAEPAAPNRRRLPHRGAAPVPRVSPRCRARAGRSVDGCQAPPAGPPGGWRRSAGPNRPGQAPDDGGPQQGGPLARAAVPAGDAPPPCQRFTMAHRAVRRALNTAATDAATAQEPRAKRQQTTVVRGLGRRRVVVPQVAHRAVSRSPAGWWGGTMMRHVFSVRPTWPSGRHASPYSVCLPSGASGDAPVRRSRCARLPAVEWWSTNTWQQHRAH